MLSKPVQSYKTNVGQQNTMPHTVNVRELGLGLISTLLLFSGAQEDIGGAEHGCNGDDLVGATASSTKRPPSGAHSVIDKDRNDQSGCQAGV